MALILNIETSTEVCSVSLAQNGHTLFKKESQDGLNHSRVLTVFIEELFKRNKYPLKKINAVAISKGPGSYTGLRIGVSVAKGLCYGLDIPLISVNSLESLGVFAARNSDQYNTSKENLPALYCPMIDARRMEVYTAVYDERGKEIRPVSAEIIDENFIADLLENHKVLFFGNGAEKCRGLLKSKNAHFEGPKTTSAEFMQLIAEEKYSKKQFEDVAYFEPFYLKNFVATIPKNKFF